MSRCSYTWEYGAKRKKCPEKIWPGSKEYCIFHDPSPEKDSELFRKKLKEKLEMKDYVFRGYYFPAKIVFSNFKFKERVDFNGATFQKDAYFSGPTFQYADFSGATFQYADFSGATFQYAVFSGATFQYAHFSGATFQYADFFRATFQDADFFRATFQKDAYFRVATFQYADFIEATFQYAYFSGATFQKDADFFRATFQDADFSGATFQKDAVFSGATFQKDAVFNKATFQKDAVFNKATFQKDAVFNKATFQCADFSGTTLEKNMEFAPKHIEELDLRFSQFYFRGTITADLKKTLFHRAYLENVAFIDCGWPEIIYEEEHIQDEDIDLTFKELETVYRDLKQNMQRHGDYSQSGKFYYREMEMRRKGSNSIKERVWLELYNLLAGYGEKPERTAFSSALTVFAFAFVYGISGCLRYTVQNPCLNQQIKDSIYFSFVTFTTLGLGDIRPLNDLGKLLICCEAVIGAFLIALFVVVFARKMMR
ncbi:MAG: pentapeptide repeat-containing protein [Theionarchaea archaeon]|nr:pentapeptide repeat-containing protein [Theionarchaea archaeon]